MASFKICVVLAVAMSMVSGQNKNYQDSKQVYQYGNQQQSQVSTFQQKAGNIPNSQGNFQFPSYQNFGQKSSELSNSQAELQLPSYQHFGQKSSEISNLQGDVQLPSYQNFGQEQELYSGKQGFLDNFQIPSFPGFGSQGSEGQNGLFGSQFQLPSFAGNNDGQNTFFGQNFQLPQFPGFQQQAGQPATVEQTGQQSDYYNYNQYKH